MKKSVAFALILAPLGALAEGPGIPANDAGRVRCDRLVKEAVAVVAYARSGSEGKTGKLAKMPIGIDRVIALPQDGKEGYQPAYEYALNDCPTGDDSCNDEPGSYSAKVYVGGNSCMIIGIERNVF